MKRGKVITIRLSSVRWLVVIFGLTYIVCYSSVFWIISHSLPLNPLLFARCGQHLKYYDDNSYSITSTLHNWFTAMPVCPIFPGIPYIFWQHKNQGVGNLEEKIRIFFVCFFINYSPALENQTSNDRSSLWGYLRFFSWGFPSIHQDGNKQVKRFEEFHDNRLFEWSVRHWSVVDKKPEVLWYFINGSDRNLLSKGKNSWDIDHC